MAKTMNRAIATTLGLMLALALCLPAQAGSAKTKRVSVSSSGAEADRNSRGGLISANGRVVAFRSKATNLVPGDNNNCLDVFVHNKRTKKTTRVSVSSDGEEGEADSFPSAISANGRLVVFESRASNLVDEEATWTVDVFVHDRKTKETTRVSESSNGIQSNFHSFGASISADGRFVAFVSYSDNLIDDDGNETADVFVHDRETKETTRVSVDSSGIESNGHSYSAAISADGRFVAFASSSDNLIDDDGNDTTDVFVHDRETNETTRVSVDSIGDETAEGSSDATISADGRFVAFESYANDLVGDDDNPGGDVFVHDRETEETELVSVRPNGAPFDYHSVGTPSISANGRFVAFEESTGFVHDREKHETIHVSVRTKGVRRVSHEARISADGRFVVFYSKSPDFVRGDENEARDVFIRGPLRDK